MILQITGIVIGIIILYLLSCVRILKEYQRGVVFRLGRVLPNAKGPGLILVFWPNLGPNLVMIILGVWIILGGLIQLFIANKYKDQVGGRNIRGIITIVLGAIIVFNPSSSVQLVSMIIGALGLLYGIYLLFLIFNFGKSK